MKLIPLLRVRNIKEAIAFYTCILDFELKYPVEELNIFCMDLINGEAELQLSEIDSLFGKYIKRGLITPKKKIHLFMKALWIKHGERENFM